MRKTGISKYLQLIVALGGVALLAGCSAVLPSGSAQQQYPWKTFKEVQQAYDSIENEKSNMEVLKEKGFDPDVTPNVSILSYMDVVKRFSPILEKQDLPQGVQQCIEAKEGCVAYVAYPSNIQRERVGNVAMDLLGFKQKTKVSGWKFEAVFVMVDGKVVYKLWSGTPSIEEYDSKIKPLGPVQNLGGVLSP